MAPRIEWRTGWQQDVIGWVEHGMRNWADHLLEAMQARVDERTGLLKESLTYDGPEYDGRMMSVIHHDGPADRGRQYGAAEEVMRGGRHAFMRPALDANIGAFVALIALELEGRGEQSGATLPAGAHGTWVVIPGSSRYVYTF